VLDEAVPAQLILGALLVTVGIVVVTHDSRARTRAEAAEASVTEVVRG
jgi:hypothetical protein